jgi:hypothetical protein
MKIIVQITIILYGICSYSQTIKEIENELSYWNVDEEFGRKIKLARKLHKIDPFNIKAIDYICDYYQEKKIDSVNYFFDNLIATNPNQPEPYLIKSDFIYRHSGIDNYLTQKINYLEKALQIAPDNIEANYSLAETYYRDFLIPFEKPQKTSLTNDIFSDSIFIKQIDSMQTGKKTSLFPNSAELALQYFKKLWSLDSSIRETIYYPIEQLKCFLKQNDILSKPENNANRFYLINQFTDFSVNWKCDASIDYLFEIQSSEGTGAWLTKQLQNLQEPNISTMAKKDSETFRFTWLRSFDHPNAIRLENLKDDYIFYWAIGKGSGGYEPLGLKKKGKRKISKSEWDNFQRLIKETNLETLPNNDYLMMTDGATWTLEYNKSGTFLAKNTNHPNKEFKSACLYLVKLAKIKIKDEDLY